MRAKIGLVTAALLAMAVGAAFRFQPQTETATLLTTATTATRDCDAATDANASTATPLCTSTGAILAEGFTQVTVPILITKSTNTILKMQCDTSTNGTTWYAIPAVDSSGTSTPRTWTHAYTITSTVTFNFEINAKYVRCRLWFLDGAVGNKVTVPVIRLGSIVGD